MRLSMTFIDYEKAFVSIQQEIINVLLNQGVDIAYMSIQETQREGGRKGGYFSLIIQ